MTDTPYIVAALRTPRGKGSARGALHGHTPVTLVTHLLAALRARATDHVDDFVLGCANPVGEQAGNVARSALLAAGWPVAVPALMVNRYCTSGLDAIAIGAAKVRAGEVALVLAGGVESVSRVAPPTMLADIGVAADLIATIEGVSREACDEYAHGTRAKASAAPPGPSIVPIGDLARDENIGFQPTRDELAALPLLFDTAAYTAPNATANAWLAASTTPRELRHVHTRGNSPSLADAAALALVGTAEAARRIGVAPRARIVATASAAADPVVMLTAGQDAVERVLAKVGVRAADVAVFEFAEAFAASCLRFMRMLDVGSDRFNPNGGTIARGHAYGATGAALVVDALEELERRRERYAVIGVSGAAGLGAAMLIERV